MESGTKLQVKQFSIEQKKESRDDPIDRVFRDQSREDLLTNVNNGHTQRSRNGSFSSSRAKQSPENQLIAPHSPPEAAGSNHIRQESRESKQNYRYED
jgi:hypothetical protein